LEPVSRRSFIARGSAGVAGAAAVTAGGGLVALSTAAEAAPLTEEEVASLDQPVMLQVRDAATGEVGLLVGEREVLITDKSLVAKVLRASR
jgi:hypothetical protein